MEFSNGVIIQYIHGFSNTVTQYPTAFTLSYHSVVAIPHEAADNNTTIGTKQMSNFSDRTKVYFRCSYDNTQIADWVIDIIAVGI